jgi:hypothetical protein
MHPLLVALLVVNTVLHGVVIARFGIKSNEPFLIFAVIYAVLALVVYFAVAYALWATLALSVFGLIGLTVTFNKVARDKTLDRIIWAADAATIAATAYLLFVR